MDAYKGVFEAHITIMPLEYNAKKKFIAFCEMQGLKPVQIELSRGDFVQQLMTSSQHKGEFEAVLASVKKIAQNLRKEGFEVKRVKLEASPFNENLPANNTEVARHPAENYFEHHLKLSLPADLAGKEVTLLQICTLHKAHLSRNAFKENKNGLVERFVTVRHYGLGRQEALACLDVLKEAITINGFQILKTITEYCVYDDDVQLDANWLTLDYSTPCEVCESACMLNPV